MSRRGEQELQQALVPEAELRMHRYEMLAQVAREIDGHFVAVAHTKDDQSETMLFRLFRGTSVFGLTGMKSVRKISGDVTLLRPMLKVSRKRCLEYLQRRGVSHCEDSSNLDLRYARNFIRHEVVSLIEQRFPCFMNRMEQLRQVISDESDFLSASPKLSCSRSTDLLKSVVLQTLQRNLPTIDDGAIRISLDCIRLLRGASSLYQ